MTRDRVFIVSLIFSFLIHLSMVTIFRIVIYFPREDIQYYALDIIDAGSRQSVLSSRWSVLRTPSPDDALAEHFSMGGEGDQASDGAPYMPAWDDLPDIELPTIEFAELGRLRLAERGEALGAHLDELLDLEPRDPWARFTEELESIGGALSRLTFGDREASSEGEKPSPIARPAAGFEAYIEWMSAPKDRRLLSAPPIRALWGLTRKPFPAILCSPSR